MITFRPLGNRVIVKQIPLTKEELIINGIEAPESAIPFRKGKVISAGIGEYAPANGQLIPMELKEGDTVAFLEAAAHVPVRMNNEDYKMFRENQIEVIILES